MEFHVKGCSCGFYKYDMMSTTPVPSTELLKFPYQFLAQDRSKSRVHHPYRFFKMSYIYPIIWRSYYTVTIRCFTHQVFLGNTALQLFGTSHIKHTYFTYS